MEAGTVLWQQSLSLLSEGSGLPLHVLPAQRYSERKQKQDRRPLLTGVQIRASLRDIGSTEQKTTEGGQTMSHELRRVSIFALAAALLLVGYVLSPELNRVTRAHAVVRADDGGACTLADAAGRWGYSYSGTIGGFGPVASVGSFVQDAAGNVNGAQTRSFVGNIAQETIKGVVIVHADCTTTGTINVYQNGVFQRTAELDGVLVDHSRGLRAIFKTAGTVITIDGRKTSGQED